MDELIQVPGDGADAPASMGRGARRAAVALLFFSSLAVALTITVDLAFPAPIKNPVGQEARDLNLAKRSRNPWDGSAAHWIETQAKTRSRIRRSLAPFWSAFLMRKLGTVPRDLVAGKDGWLFLRDRVQPPVETRARSIHLTGIAAAAMDRRLARLGSRLIFMPIPRKAAACEEMLPRGMKGDVGYEIGIAKAFESRGLEQIDVLEVMRGLAPEQRYFRRDSHWTFTAGRSLADALASAYPALATQELDLGMEGKPVPAAAHLLTFAAIDLDHPAAQWINQDVTLRPVIKSPKLRARMGKSPVDVDVAVVGSSFTRNFGFADMVAASLGRLVYPGGIAATPFGGSLAYGAGRFRDLGLPSFMLYEFPVHQTFGLGDPERGLQRSLAAFFVATSQAGTTALPAELLGPLPPVRTAMARVEMVFLPGMLLSSGDGVLQLRLKTTSKTSSEWTLESSATKLRWNLGDGDRDSLLPVLQSHANGFAVSLKGVGKRGVPPEAGFEVVVDADLSRSVEVPLTSLAEPQSSELQSTGPSFEGVPIADSVGLHDVATVQWAGAPDAVEVIIRGTTPGGEEREVQGQFRKPLSRICVLSLTPFEAGHVTSIEIRGASEGVRAFIAPQLAD